MSEKRVIELCEAERGIIRLFNAVKPMRRSVHGIVTKGGEAPNIIPERAQAWFYVRGEDDDELAEAGQPVAGVDDEAGLGGEDRRPLVGDDVERLGLRVRTQQGEGGKALFRVADQNPADGCRWKAAVIQAPQQGGPEGVEGSQPREVGRAGVETEEGAGHPAADRGVPPAAERLRHVFQRGGAGLG